MDHVNDGFYERYGHEWSMTERRKAEQLSTINKVLNLLSLMQGLTFNHILDFGCGLGDALDILAKLLHPVDAIGIDISSKMISYAKNQYPDYTFIQGNHKKIKDFQVDLITFFDVLEHLENIPFVLQTAIKHSKYIAIKIPLEKTWIIDIFNKLRLKENKSRMFESEGHLYEFNQNDFEHILRAEKLKILRTKTAFSPKYIQFSDYMIHRMKAKPGYIGVIKYYLYTTLSKFPYTLTRPLFQIVNGVDYYVICKT